MGNGSWAASSFYDRAASRAAAGVDTFHYSKTAKATGMLRVHQTLDPQGLIARESRDSAEHPNSNAIIIGLDVTGSMDRVVRGIHANLPQLHELLLGNRYLPDPQILFAAVGDATCDRVPLQVGQFESDNRMDENLEHMILEGGGGGQDTESYELMLYTAARHTAIDCWEKRRRKGYLFIIGDERAYPSVSAHRIRSLIGDPLQADVPTEQIVAEAMEKYHVYFIIPGGAAHGADQRILHFWNELLGPQRVIALKQPEETSACIALTIGVNEGAVDATSAMQQLQHRGMVGRAIDNIMQALRNIMHGGASDPSGTKPTRHL
jgi:hypothetical protein